MGEPRHSTATVAGVALVVFCLALAGFAFYNAHRAERKMEAEFQRLWDLSQTCEAYVVSNNGRLRELLTLLQDESIDRRIRERAAEMLREIEE